MRGFLREEALRKKKGKCRVIFLDRDGVINKRMPVHCHVTSCEDLEILPDVYEALGLLDRAGYVSLVITNQRCIALGTLDEKGLSLINDKMIRDLDDHGTSVSGMYYCPHDNGDHCSCRKPQTGLFEEACRDLEAAGITVDKEGSWMIGDEDTDIEAGKRFGVNTVKIGDDVPDLLAAVRMITGTR